MLKQWLIDYCHDVLSGEIIACQKHKWVCQRFLRDIEREGTDEFPYVFDIVLFMIFVLSTVISYLLLKTYCTRKNKMIFGK
ncbi:MAG TPA: hypothetical protein VEY68_05180 [Anoxybacillus sp.]|jgi:phage terminase large subunit-like protein|nr:hypothetical protein [Anoxybacillus sp.]